MQNDTASNTNVKAEEVGLTPDDAPASESGPTRRAPTNIALASHGSRPSGLPASGGFARLATVGLVAALTGAMLAAAVMSPRSADPVDVASGTASPTAESTQPASSPPAPPSLPELPGVDIAAPSVQPDASAAPQAPSEPSVPDVPELPDLPNLPQSGEDRPATGQDRPVDNEPARNPAVPDFPDLPGLPGLSSAPSPSSSAAPPRTTGASPAPATAAPRPAATPTPAPATPAPVTDTRPVAANDYFQPSTAYRTYGYIDLLVFENDYDPAGPRFADGSELKFQRLTAATHGDLEPSSVQCSDGSGRWCLRYYPHHVGPYRDAFTYTIVDAGGNTATATVTIDVP